MSSPAYTRQEEDATECERLLQTVFQLQKQLIERDSSIHDLHKKAHTAQEDEYKKLELKKGFSIIEKRHVDTTDTAVVLRDAMHHLTYTLAENFSATAGIVILDVPYNSNIGATNQDLKIHKSIGTYWSETSQSALLLTELENLNYYRDVITQKKGKVYSAWENLMMKEENAAVHELRSLMALPVVVDGVSIALVIIVNGEPTERDPPLVKEVLTELWTSNVQPLINIALDSLRQKETETKLVSESVLRDEVLLALDTILDEVVKSTQTDDTARRTTESLWRAVLQRLANFFDDYFECDCFVAVTNTSANFRLHQFHKGSSTGTRSTERGSAISGGRPSDLEFIHYSFSDSLLHVRKTRMKHLSHPLLKDSKLMRSVMDSAKPMYDPTCKTLNFPCGHMKMNSIVLVPIVFAEESVGMLGLANGDFTSSTGRILQSVFTTFWSMIVKSTKISEGQAMANNVLPKKIAERRKAEPEIADEYPSSTVLVANVVGFSEFARPLSAFNAVKFLNIVVTRIDLLVAKFGVEKIKVNGDTYIAAGGIADKSGKARTLCNRVEQSQMVQMVDLGFAILEDALALNSAPEIFPQEIQARLKEQPLQMRVGLAEGSVTAGVFGDTMSQYDLIGDAVTVAAKLESACHPGSVHTNSTVFDELCADYRFEKRRPIALKGMGMQQTYFILGKNQNIAADKKPALASPPSAPITRESIQTLRENASNASKDSKDGGSDDEKAG